MTGAIARPLESQLRIVPETMKPVDRIGVVGLGYVGLPLAVAFARQYQVTGFDIGAHRVATLRAGNDFTG